MLAALVAGTAIGGVAVWAVTRSGGGSGPKATATTVSTGPAGVSATGQELLGRLDAGRKATFHVRYAFGSELSGQVIVEVWHTPDRVRRDIRASSPAEGSTHTAEILDKQQFVRCAQVNGKAWQCVGAPPQSSNLIDPVGGAGHDVQSREVTVTDDTIAGQAVRCYTVAPAAAAARPTQFCLSAENVPLRIDGGDGKPTQATNFDLGAPADSVFVPPASLQTGGSP